MFVCPLLLVGDLDGRHLDVSHFITFDFLVANFRKLFVEE